MMSYRIGQVAELLGVSVDTVRRWADAGRLGARRTEGGQRGHARRVRDQPSARRGAGGGDGAVGPQPVHRDRDQGRQGPDRRAGRSAGRPAPGGVADDPRGRRRAGAHPGDAGGRRGQGDQRGRRASIPTLNPGGVPMVRSRFIRSAPLLLAAALLAAACGKIGRQFTAANPNTEVTFNFAGSQALATQIQQGAPADVFASADTTNMGKVKDLVGTPQNFASNLLRIVVAKGNPKAIKGLSGLSNPDLKVVLAAPEVPAGRYAQQALAAQHVTVKPVSLEDNVKAVVTKVSLGEADAGIVYVTDVTAGGDKVEGVDIPNDKNVPATCPIATVQSSSHQSQARAFMNMVVSDQGRQVLMSFGFLPPPAS